MSHNIFKKHHTENSIDAWPYTSTNKTALSEAANFTNEYAFNLKCVTSDVMPKLTPIDASKIDIKTYSLTVGFLVNRIIDEGIDIAPPFRLKADIWENAQKSRLIESLLLKIPLHPFYFSVSDGNKWQIVDGLQRLSTIKEYMTDERFILSDTEFLTGLNGHNFISLPRFSQRHIEEASIEVHLISRSTPENVRYNIIRRINPYKIIIKPPKEL